MEKFRLYFKATPEDLIKAGDGDDGKMIVKGVVSTTRRDLDGQVLKPSGFDLSYFTDYGFINWNHQAAKDPSAIIGEPIEAKIEGDKFIVKAELYKDNPLAVAAYKLATSLKKANNGRHLAFSLEGKVLEKNQTDESIIEKSIITHVAITATPKNRDSFLEIGKSEDYEHDGDLIEPFVGCDGDTYCVNKSMKINIIKSVDFDETRQDTADNSDKGTGSGSEGISDGSLSIISKAIEEGMIDGELVKEALIKGFADSDLNKKPVYTKTGAEVKNKLRSLYSNLTIKETLCLRKMDEEKKKVGEDPEKEYKDGDWELHEIPASEFPYKLKRYDYEQMYEKNKKSEGDIYASEHMSISSGESKESPEQERREHMYKYNDEVRQLIKYCVEKKHIDVMLANLNDNAVIPLSNYTAVELGF
jgi:hypothetical protein